MRGRRPSPHPLALLRLVQVGSQAVLAAALTARGVSTTPQAVSRWERGQAIPSEERLELLSVLMRLRPQDLDSLFWPFLGDLRDPSIGDRATVSTVDPEAAQGDDLMDRRSAPRAERLLHGAPAPFSGSDA